MRRDAARQRAVGRAGLRAGAERQARGRPGRGSQADGLGRQGDGGGVPGHAGRAGGRHRAARRLRRAAVRGRGDTGGRSLLRSAGHRRGRVGGQRPGQHRRARLDRRVCPAPARGARPAGRRPACLGGRARQAVRLDAAAWHRGCGRDRRARRTAARPACAADRAGHPQQPPLPVQAQPDQARDPVGTAAARPGVPVGRRRRSGRESSSRVARIMVRARRRTARDGR